jgi:hypothetical protein
MDGDNSIADAWKFFAKHALPPGCSDVQTEDMHYAFWAGCATAFAKIADIMNEEDQDIGQQQLTALAAEIEKLAFVVARKQPKTKVIGEVLKIDATGRYMHVTAKEDAEMNEALRMALDKTGAPIVFDEQAKADLKARGMTEDDILAMLATAIGHKQ